MGLKVLCMCKLFVLGAREFEVGITECVWMGGEFKSREGGRVYQLFASGRAAGRVTSLGVDCK